MSTPFQRVLPVIVSCVLIFFSCKPGKNVVVIPTGPVAGINDTAIKWLDWVGVFKPGTDSTVRAAYLDSLRNQLLAVRSDYPISPADSGARPYTYYVFSQIRDSFAGAFQLSNVQVNLCNCGDDQLWNVSADLLKDTTGTTGESSPTTIKPPSNPTVKGADVDLLADNEDMHNPGGNSSILVPSGVVDFPGASSNRTVIAVIDTGLDTALLSEQIRPRILWHGPSGGQNLMLGGNAANYTDDHPVRHGTAVSTIAMKAFFEESGGRELPQLMILKAADATGSGTLFEYTCALAFAIRNNANIINSSMGFYGQPTPLIDYYLRIGKEKNIVLVTAAGNADSTHQIPLCRDATNPANRLQSPNHMFYPAAMASDIERYLIVSVTGESRPGLPCYFQNYSQEYVTLGVVNTPADNICCFFRLPFIDQEHGLEGSSFATPVVSGRLGFKISANGPQHNVQACLSVLGNVNRANGMPVTRGNQYIEYTP